MISPPVRYKVPSRLSKREDASESDVGKESDGGRESGDASNPVDAAKPEDAGTGDAGTDDGVCDPVKQTGCPSADECTLNSDNNLVCAAGGAKTIGQFCNVAISDDCATGYVCTTDIPDGVPQCQQFCATDSDCTQPAVGPPGNKPHCLVTFADSVSDSVAKACDVACNPVTAAGASGCQTGLTCQYGGTSSLPEVTSCETSGTATDGTLCQGINDGLLSV
jgi:hypothetical protein